MIGEGWYIVHVTGTTPNAVDQWTKVYRTLPAAAAQATRWTHDRAGRQRGDWKAGIFKIVPLSTDCGIPWGLEVVDR